MAKQRTVSVQFYAVLPRNRHQSWPDGIFPAEDALSYIAKLPPEDRRVQRTLLMERTGHVTGDVPRQLLSVHNVALGATRREARGGEVVMRQYGEDEGPAEPTFVMFFGRVAAVVKLNGGPHPVTLPHTWP
jgi:hypothetical protein